VYIALNVETQPTTRQRQRRIHDDEPRMMFHNEAHYLVISVSYQMHNTPTLIQSGKTSVPMLDAR